MTKKTIKRASADVGLMFTAYNLRRILNIIGKEVLRCFDFLFFEFLASIWTSLESFWRMHKYYAKIGLKIRLRYNGSIC
jgi:hypothetical protein